MMIIEINEDNAGEFKTLISEDMAENMERMFYRGLAAQREEESDPSSFIIWQLVHSEEEDEDTLSVIEAMELSDEEAAEALFDAYKRRIDQEEVKRSEFAIPAKKGGMEKALLKKAGFTVKFSEGDHIVVKVSEFRQLPFMKMKNMGCSVSYVKDLSVRNFRRGIARSIEKNRKGICEDLAYLPMGWFEPEVSSYAEKDDEVNGLLLFHHHPSGILSLQLMTAYGKDYQKTLVTMMRQSILAMEERYPEDTHVILDRHNESAFLLSEKLFPRGFGVPVYMGSREET